MEKLRSSLSDLNLSTPLMSGQGEGEGPLEGAGPGWGLALPELYFTLILPVYCSVILLASLGCSLVILSVLLNKSLRTAGNVYLVNLAVSDLLLVLLACPATLAQLSASSWPGPSLEPLCQLAMFLPLLFSFTSTFSICLIALDRHHMILNTSRTTSSNLISLSCIMIIWVAAALCAAPIIPNTKLDIVQLRPDIILTLGIKQRSYCMEDWGTEYGRLAYSITVLCIQFLLPSTILLLAHIRIYRKLSSLPFWGQLRQSMPREGIELAAVAQTGVHHHQPRNHRAQKTTYLLVSVVVVFMCSWFPLNFLNVLLDLGFYKHLFSNENHPDGDDSLFRIVFSICHLVGMSSALANPIIYGFFNQGFRKAFAKALSCNFLLGNSASRASRTSRASRAMTTQQHSN